MFAEMRHACQLTRLGSRGFASIGGFLRLFDAPPKNVRRADPGGVSVVFRALALSSLGKQRDSQGLGGSRPSALQQVSRGHHAD